MTNTVRLHIIIFYELLVRARYEPEWKDQTYI